jgi:hypothetical protein
MNNYFWNTLPEEVMKVGVSIHTDEILFKTSHLKPLPISTKVGLNDL